MTHLQCASCDETRDFSTCSLYHHQLIAVLDEVDISNNFILPADVASYANSVLARYTFKTLEDTKEILVYDNGFYKNNGEVKIIEECYKIIPKCTSHVVREIIFFIKAKTFTDRKLFNNDFSKLVIENGILDLDTLELTDFDSKFLSTIKIPVSYDPDAKCPLFEKFLEDCLSTEEDRITAMELMANILTANRKNLEKSCICIGDGSNGKSTWLKVIVGIIGKDNCSSISIHALQSERFAPAQLYGKLANIFADISNRELNNLGKFKMSVSGDAFEVEKKGQDHFMMQSFAKHFYSANEMPDIKDDSSAAFRRILVLKFENKFLEGSGRIDNYDQILLREASGIFNLMLQHYKNLMKNESFTFNQSIESVRETIKLESDKLREFVETCLIQQADSFITKDDLYQKYLAWCKFHSYDALTKAKLGNRLPNYGFKDERKHLDKTTRVWSGYNWNFDNEWVKSNVRRQEQLV